MTSAAGAVAAPALRLRLFGAPALRRAERPVKLGLKRGLGLLAYLALEERPVPRDHLAVLLWPEAGIGVGRTRLRRLIYQIEEACGTDLIVTVQGSLSMAGGALHCDAVAFRRAARDLVSDTPNESPLDDLLQQAREACDAMVEGLAFGSEAFDDWVSRIRIEHQHLLTRTLTRIAELQQARREPGLAADTLELLLRQDPYCEPAYVLRMSVAAEARDAAGVEAAYSRCADALRAEFGCKPSGKTEMAYLQLRSAASSATSGNTAAFTPDRHLDIRFAAGPHGSVAYSVLGSGSEAIVVMTGFVSQMEIGWEHPGVRDMLQALAQRYTVVVFDRRGVGLSERLDATGSVSSCAADVLTILDAASIRRAWLFGSSEGGPAAIELAAARPDRVSGLVLFGAMAKGSRDEGYPWALLPQAFDAWMAALVAGWGGPANIETFAPAAAADPAERAWWARLLRHGASPASLRAVLAGLRDADVRHLLPKVRQPTLVMHRRGDQAVRFEAGEYLARNLPHASFVALEGENHWWWLGDRESVLASMQDFIARHRTAQR